MTACSSYQRSEYVCRNGFIQTLPCSGMDRGCPHCGEPSKIIPWCLREDIPARWLDDSGRPRFAPKLPALGGRENHG